MAYTAEQLIVAYTAAHVGVAPDAGATALLNSYAARTQTGQLAESAALSLIVNTADNTTAVAVTTYQFFTGKTPTQPGLAFLVNSSANGTDLSDAYYSGFNIENRYMSFAANLALLGEGSAAFAATYGGLGFPAYAASLYETIIGSAFAAAAGVDVAAALADIAGRQPAFVQTARDRGLITAASTAAQVDLAAKAVAAGYLLVEGVKADIGLYALGSNNFIKALMYGTPQYNVDLIASYSLLGEPTGKAVQEVAIGPHPMAETGPVAFGGPENGHVGPAGAALSLVGEFL